MSVCPHPGPRQQRILDARDTHSGAPFTIQRCGECGLLRTHPVPDAATLRGFYPAGYHARADGRRFPGPVEALQRALSRRRAAAIERMAGGPGAVLDLGCGPGFLLDAFRARGWRTQGSELDDATAATARARGLAVHSGPLADAPWGPAAFDAVVLWHVLEHLSDPDAALSCARRWLRPGGVLLVGVPNIAGVEARWARGHWFHLDVPRHLVHFGPETLARLLDTHGFDVVRWAHIAPEYDLFSFVQSMQNRLGLRPNRLYDRLRGIRRPDAGALDGAADLGALLLAAPLALVGLPMTLAAAALRRGSALTVWARRRP